ncbi:hypothetical protein OV450_3393 [Actinobacteria bacterium OV450]|nr:hypothetical protein OV450_3393 [Actinobacteria bacterium OV450]
MTPEEKLARRRKLNKRGAFLRAQGVELRVPFQPAQTVLRRLQAQGMTAEQMSAQCGIHWSRLRQIARGYSRINDPEGTRLNKIRLRTHEAIMTLEYEQPTYGGAKVPAEWVTRRLQALAALGFNARLLAGMLGWEGDSAHKMLSDLTRGRRRERHVVWTTYKQVADLYDKLKDATPEDHDGAYRPQTIRAWARKNRYAPPHCWDDDTINDVDAIPEWTGMCGTIEGWRIHQREYILPICPPCQVYRREYEKERRRGHKQAMDS